MAPCQSKTLQAASGIAFASFLALHLLNALFANTGQGAYDEVLRVFRIFYQHPLIEPTLIFSSLLVHSGLGISQVIIRWKRQREIRSSSFRLPISLLLHRWSGYVLLSLVGSHVAMTRLPSVLSSSNPSSSFAHIGWHLESHPWIFLPYYLLLSSAGVIHAALGTARAMEILFSWSGWRRNRGATVCAATMASLAIVGCASAVFAFRGSFFPVSIDPGSRRIFLFGGGGDK